MPDKTYLNPENTFVKEIAMLIAISTVNKGASPEKIGEFLLKIKTEAIRIKLNDGELISSIGYLLCNMLADLQKRSPQIFENIFKLLKKEGETNGNTDNSMQDLQKDSKV